MVLFNMAAGILLFFFLQDFLPFPAPCGHEHENVLILQGGEDDAFLCDGGKEEGGREETRESFWKEELKVLYYHSPFTIQTWSVRKDGLPNTSLLAK